MNKTVIIKTTINNRKDFQINQLSANILLVENEMINQMVATAMLETMGHIITVAENGQEAVNILIGNKHKYDVILMDCQMPIMDGFKATQIIRHAEQKNKITKQIIIAMTASTMPGQKDKCFAAGMDDYISKPIKLETLNKKIKNWLQ